MNTTGANSNNETNKVRKYCIKRTILTARFRRVSIHGDNKALKCPPSSRPRHRIEMKGNTTSEHRYSELEIR